MKSYHLALENFECVLLLVPRFENFVGTSSSKPAGANTSRFVGTSSSRTWTIPSSSPLSVSFVLFYFSLHLVQILYLGHEVSSYPCSSSRVFDTSDTNSRTLSGADSSFIGDASFERHSKAYEEAQNPIPSKSNHSTQEVANICDDDDHLEDIPLPTSPEVPAISTPALVTSSPLSSSTILGQRAIPLVDIVDPLKDLNFLFLT
ncbi:hypothetical protein GH714_035096 [Hevea brasiliensis]|uniref:Uncharacterized protein n=1 Tax=Hevea brasiliensis TaxID=3981 RepID=A0A6A6LVT5_HEVBR|nr:hypothetical protein GH714_035096 [Hevea brasiliensis]